VDDPGIPNAPFHLFDADTAASPIKLQTTDVPEPATLGLVGLALGLGRFAERRSPSGSDGGCGKVGLELQHEQRDRCQQ
jgi:hypothetical protein